MNASVRKYLDALAHLGFNNDFFLRGVDLDARNLSVRQLKDHLTGAALQSPALDDVLRRADSMVKQKVSTWADVSPAQFQIAQAIQPVTPPPDPVATALASGDVKALQTALNVTGANLKVDGVRGAKTNAALAAYQGAHPTATTPAGAPPGAPAVRAPTGSGGGSRTVTAPPAAPPGPAVPKTDQEIRDYVATNYGYAASYLNDPEIGGILLRAAKEGWDEARLKGALFATNWWKSTTDAQRNYDKTAALDPATARNQLLDRQDQLAHQAESLGITIPTDRLANIARDSLRNNWSAQQIQQALGHEFHYQAPTGGKSQQTGQALTTEQSLKDTAAQYLVPLSDSTLAQWEGQILSGDVTPDQFQGYVREQAKSLFPGLAKAIDSGITVAQYVAPYKETAAQLLEVAPESINMSDPKYLRGISSIDPKTGDRTAMNLADWQTYIKSMPEWRNTNNANEAASGLTNQLLQTFGAVA